MTREKEWTIAYAKQAKADLAARETLLQKRDTPECQQLHFLQMACEKAAKAYAYGLKGVPKKIRRSHNYIRKFIPAVYKEEFLAVNGREVGEKSLLLKQVRHLAQEIEFLQPAIDYNKRRPDNSEYPWEDSAGNIRIPMEHAFPNLDMLRQTFGVRFLKLLLSAVDRMSQP